MLETIKNGQPFTYEKLSPEEMQSRGILGRLVGIIADLKKPTRNGRLYSEKLWDNVFNDPIMEEKLQTKALLGELEHPTDGRSQPDPTKACICLAEKPKKKDGKLYGVFDILNTPNGKILKTLCDYGTVIGVSSRGEGDVMDSYDGQEQVDPSTYECFCWDAVCLPAVKDARMTLVNESLDTNKKSLDKILTETYDNASEEDKLVMKETIDRIKEDIERPILKEAILEEECDYEVHIPVEEIGRWSMEIFPEDIKEHGIKVFCNGKEIEEFDELWPDLAVGERYPHEENHEVKDGYLIVSCEVPEKQEEVKTESKEECDNQEDCTDKVEVNENIGVEDIKPVMNELQEALKAQKELKASTKELQGKLAVSDAKVEELSEELNKYKDLCIKLSESAKNSKELNKSLTEKLNNAKAKGKTEAKALTESVTKKTDEVKVLNEKLVRAVSAGKALNENVKSLNEQLNSSKEELTKANNEIKTLKESLEDAKQNIVIKTDELTSKVTKAVKIAEAYKKAANETMDHYIESKARMIGVSKNEIKNKLAKTYTADDVDTVCESLRSYHLNMSKLPFEVAGAKVKFTESKNDNLRVENMADEIDDQLIEMVRNLH